MGSKESSEAEGVICSGCGDPAPRNDWKFFNEEKTAKLYIFYDEEYDGGKKICKYARRFDVSPPEYYCMDCIKDGKAKSISWRVVNKLVQGKALIYFYGEENTPVEWTCLVFLIL